MYISVQIEKAYPAGVTRVGYLSEISPELTPLRRPVAAIQLKAMTPRVAIRTRMDRIRSVPFGDVSMASILSGGIF